jgi:hypothetical protein
MNRRELLGAGTAPMGLGTRSAWQVSAGNTTRSQTRSAFTPGEPSLDTPGELLLRARA